MTIDREGAAIRVACNVLFAALTTAPARRYHDPSECPHLAWVQHEGRCTGCNGPAVAGQSDA